MKKTHFEKLLDRMPKPIRLINESDCDLTDDEYVCAATWIKGLTLHFEENGQTPMHIKFAPISKRLYLDLGLFYHEPKDDPIVCICKNSRASVKHNERLWLL